MFITFKKNMILLYILLFLMLSMPNFSLSNKTTKNVLTFTHQMSTSHLSFVFNIAEYYPSPKQIYDIRWPIVDAIDQFPTRKNFIKLIFSKPLGTNEALMKNTNFTEIIKLIPKIINGILMPCMLQDSYPTELHQNNATLALIDPFAPGCAIAVSRNFNAKIVITSPLIELCTLQYYTGGPLPISYGMSNIIAKLKMNFFHRTLNFFAHQIFKLFLYQLSLAKLFKYFDPSKNNLYSFPKPTLTFVNYHKFVELPFPRTNAFKDVGNSLSAFDNQISTEITNFINQYNQIVLLSFSTYTNDGVVSTELYSNYTKVFKNFPKIGFIWRQKEKLDSLPENVILSSWINQRAIISHEKTKALITHCGLNSVVEGLNVGIPIICIPEGNDQYLNAEKLQHFSLTTVIDQQSLSSEDLTKALENILNENSAIKKNALKMKKMFEFEREKGISTNITWNLKKFEKIETLDFEKFYIPKGSQICWSNYFLIDWIFVIFIIVCVTGV